MAHLGLFVVILISWMIAFFESCFQVPANRIGYPFHEKGSVSLEFYDVINDIKSLTLKNRTFNVSNVSRPAEISAIAKRNQSL